MKPGIYPNMTNAEYHAADGVSSSRLGRLASKSPAHMRYGKPKASDDMDLGTLTHTAILEPERFDNSYVICDSRTNSKIYKAAKAEAEAEGKLLVKSEMVANASDIREAIHRKTQLSRLISDGRRFIEHSAFAKDSETGLLLRCRPDLIRHDLGLMIDLKTTRSADNFQFPKSIGQYKYHLQAAMYLDVWRQALGSMIDGPTPTYIVCSRFIFLAVEKDPPYEAALFELDPISMQEGHELYRDCLDQYLRCQRDDFWPGYSTDIQQVALPSYFMRSPPKPEIGSLGFPRK